MKGGVVGCVGANGICCVRAVSVCQQSSGRRFQCEGRSMSVNRSRTMSKQKNRRAVPESPAFPPLTPPTLLQKNKNPVLEQCRQQQAKTSITDHTAAHADTAVPISAPTPTSSRYAFRARGGQTLLSPCSVASSAAGIYSIHRARSRKWFPQAGNCIAASHTA
jgi:hypothetical protein